MPSIAWSQGLLLLFGVISVANGNTSPFCELKLCQNGGVCSVTSLADAPGGFKAYQKEGTNPLPSSLEHNWDHCECPSGYTGAFCEIKLVPCDSTIGSCLNGMDCVGDLTDKGDDLFHCGCDGLVLIPEYAKRYCEHLAIHPCGGDSGRVCANAGECITLSNGKTDCNCAPGYSGPSCTEQVVKAVDYTKFRPKSDDEIRKTQVSLSVLGFGLLVTCLAIVGVRRYRNRRQMMDPNEQTPNLPIDDLEMS